MANGCYCNHPCPYTDCCCGYSCVYCTDRWHQMHLHPEQND